jgi:hypothetical protein
LVALSATINAPKAKGKGQSMPDGRKMSNGRASLPPVLFPNAYLWLVLVSALDLMLTWVILHFGGREGNALAAAVIERFGLIGLIAFKFAIVILVIVLCEWAGRRKPKAGLRLAVISIAITCIPILLSFYYLMGGRLTALGH